MVDYCSRKFHFHGRTCAFGSTLKTCTGLYPVQNISHTADCMAGTKRLECPCSNRLDNKEDIGGLWSQTLARWYSCRNCIPAESRCCNCGCTVGRQSHSRNSPECSCRCTVHLAVLCCSRLNRRHRRTGRCLNK